MPCRAILFPMLLSGGMFVSGCSDPLAQQKLNELSTTGHLRVSAADLIAIATPDAPAAKQAPVSQIPRTAAKTTSRATTTREPVSAPPKRVAKANPPAGTKKRLVPVDASKRSLTVEDGEVPSVVELDLMSD